MNKSHLKSQSKRQSKITKATVHKSSKKVAVKKNLKKSHTVSSRDFSSDAAPSKPARQKTYMIDSTPFYDFDGIRPEVTERTFVSNTAKVIGDVKIGHNSCVLDHVTIRGDNAKITIGNYTNIQEGTIIHVDTGFPVVIGDYVTIGHGAVIHGCTIKSNTLIGMGATVMNGAVVGENSIVGANSMILQKKQVPPKSLMKGSPAKPSENPTTEQDHTAILASAFVYADKIDQFFEMKKVQPNIMPHIQDV